MSVIGNRLKRAREAKGLSLRKLEAAIERRVSAQALGKYERGEMAPSFPVLLALAKALTVEPDYLTTTREIRLTDIDFRQAPQLTVLEERALKAAILDRLERYLHLEALFPDLDGAWNAPEAPEFAIRGVADAEQAANKLRELWRLGIDPIPHMAELLEQRGIKVIAIELAAKVSGSSASVLRPGEPSVQAVIVNARHDGMRQRFTLARELAHLVLKTAGLDDKEKEQAAERFAQAFLMARESTQKVLGGSRASISLGELVELQRMFKVGVAHLVERCAQLEILSSVASNGLKGQIRALGSGVSGAEEPVGLAAERPQRMTRLCLRAVAESALTEADAADLLCMTVPDLRLRMVGGNWLDPADPAQYGLLSREQARHRLDESVSLQ